jgi:hypothetical protein
MGGGVSFQGLGLGISTWDLDHWIPHGLKPIPAWGQPLVSGLWPLARYLSLHKAILVPMWQNGFKASEFGGSDVTNRSGMVQNPRIDPKHAPKPRVF